jgi:hypothetical protein
MCWKQEWAAAIGNIGHSIKHVERAQAKLEKRQQKNLDTMLRRHNDRWTVKTVSALYVRNTIGIEQCKEVVRRLRAEQAWLYAMIQTFGITNPQGRGKSKRLVLNMGGYNPKSKPGA